MRPNKFLLPTAAKKKKTFQLYLKFCLLFHYGQTCLQKQTFIASRTKEVSCLQISTNVRKQCFGLVWFFLHYSDRKKARSAPAFLAEFLGWNGLMIYIVHSYELSYKLNNKITVCNKFQIHLPINVWILALPLGGGVLAPSYPKPTRKQMKSKLDINNKYCSLQDPYYKIMS